MTWKTIAKDILIYILKVLVVILLVALAFIIGTMIGYSVIGEAGDPMDVFNPEIWQNILNYIF
ncbi:MAG: DNA-directed RNA polymerase subunit beta [Alkalibacterium gilvum]|uniref:DNA-directed RNA polymerase subunit beta n=1 Tax=Alkalibacterium gilvum TaxID=1130080 RepID=A0A1H6TIS1_9LACT|nr:MULTISPECIES: DNA-directed RNA polymerase subunit beta [Alkalibacterium]MDN6194690.1 DNA-directed RNA polymerase subunit beta [Alkalibacterium sp.]MDN6294043.1 DNA-directed RNA polymerase subunit beta [Alkalibacterium sp.]MDN6296034.1 DNA-directed RNA polymerase subunit beta [Alkalibacterium sp.]MDN6398416.1 DNA-directed RNA polymerase subunit beta [Alkalibacterium sp.]MDN6729079.1 DNA-directed RNA polymerase subunit beta [Alkalibacterium sp.]